MTRRVGVQGAGMLSPGMLGAVAPVGGGVLIPHSLEYDGLDQVDCGNNAPIMDLHSSGNGMRIDVYFQIITDPTTWPNFTSWALASQHGGGAGGGWWLDVRHLNGVNMRIDFNIVDSGGVTRIISQAFVSALNGWYYATGRRAAGATWSNIYAGVNAVESAPLNINGGMNGTNDFLLADRAAGNALNNSRIVYSHAFDTDPGALAAVPVTPIALGANTAGRWIHYEGAGLVLHDDSGNGNDGALIGPPTWSNQVPLGWSL